MILAPVLLIEDNLDDVELTRLAFAEAGIAHPLVVAHDGALALDWLDANRHALPSLILLDLNLPRLDGREVVQAIRADPALRHLPVVALSSSGEPNDIDATYACGADSYLQKPVDFLRFIDDVRRLRVQWLGRLAAHAAVCAFASCARWYSVALATSSREPRNTGTRWCSCVGAMSSMRVRPLVAAPPACSMSIAHRVGFVHQAQLAGLRRILACPTDR